MPYITRRLPCRRSASWYVIPMLLASVLSTRGQPPQIGVPVPPLGPGRPRSWRESMLGELRQRIREVREGPDGYLYLLTDEDDGALLRIEPAQHVG